MKMQRVWRDTKIKREGRKVLSQCIQAVQDFPLERDGALEEEWRRRGFPKYARNPRFSAFQVQVSHFMYLLTTRKARRHYVYVPEKYHNDVFIPRSAQCSNKTDGMCWQLAGHVYETNERGASNGL